MFEYCKFGISRELYFRDWQRKTCLPRSKFATRAWFTYISIGDRVILPFREGFILTKLRIAKINPLESSEFTISKALTRQLQRCKHSPCHFDRCPHGIVRHAPCLMSHVNKSEKSIITVLSAKNDRDVIFCLQLLNKTFTDVPRPLTNNLWVFLFQTIDAECVK